MARSKYETNVAPFLNQIEVWKKKGMTIEDMASRLRVAESTLNLYLKKGREGEAPYSEFSDLLDKVEIDLTESVKDSLYKKTQGYNAKIKKHFKVKVIDYDETTGRKLREHEELREVEDEVHVAADTQAIIFWLTRRAPDDWPLHPADQDLGNGRTGVIALPPLPTEELQPSDEIKAMLDAQLAGDEAVKKDG